LAWQLGDNLQRRLLHPDGGDRQRPAPAEHPHPGKPHHQRSADSNAHDHSHANTHANAFSNTNSRANDEYTQTLQDSHGHRNAHPAAYEYAKDADTDQDKYTSAYQYATGAIHNANAHLDHGGTTSDEDQDAGTAYTHEDGDANGLPRRRLRLLTAHYGDPFG
jgi:hypothetical protein